MMRVLVDSFYFFAILNPSDAAHATAVEISKHNSAFLVTTTALLTHGSAWMCRRMSNGFARPRKAVGRGTRSHTLQYAVSRLAHPSCSAELPL
jgi:hypothetical protein